MRRAYAGVNASDVNFTSGRYFGSPEQSAKQLPFYAGFEAVGVVAAVGEGVKGECLPFCMADRIEPSCKSHCCSLNFVATEGLLFHRIEGGRLCGRAFLWHIFRVGHSA